MSETSRVLHLLGPESVELRHVPIPKPGHGELLVRVDRATSCGTDLKVYLRGGHPTMLRAPCPFGHELSGTVVACGRGVESWVEGDAVVVANSASCGSCAPCRAGRENLCIDLQYLNGAFGEHLLVPRRFVRRSTYRRPEGLAPAAAALAEPLACVLHGLEMCPHSEAGELVILGVGPVGLLFVIEAAHRGMRIVAADLVADRLAMAQRLGATRTVRLEGKDGDIESLRAACDRGSGAGLVIEATGVPAAWSMAMATAAPGGTVVLFGGCAPGTTVGIDTHRLHYSELTVRGVYHHRPATFAAAIERLQESSDLHSALLSEEVGLGGVEQALQSMRERRILKAAIDPWR